MNRYTIIAIVLIALVVGGGAYKVSHTTDAMKTEDTLALGTVRDITVTVMKDRWEFKPDMIEVDEGDTVKLRFVNEDSYDHGVQIDAYGISQRLPARSTVDIPQFKATNAGAFPFVCSIPCGSGMVDGKERGHFDQTGVLKVRSRT